MIVVVADTTPLNYLLLIDAEALFPALFQRIVIPAAVLTELKDRGAPSKVRGWAESPPNWLEVREIRRPIESNLSSVLGPGEAEAIALASEIEADVLLLDDHEARVEAANYGLRVIGTLGVLERAAELRLISLPEMLNKLRATNFRISETLVELALSRDSIRSRRV